MHRQGACAAAAATTAAALANNMNSNLASQEVMASLSKRHRRQGVLRLQRFCAGIRAGAEGHFGYYAIGFHSSSPSRDGKYRKLMVKVKIPGVKLEYRQGYYAAGGTSNTPARRIASRS